MLLFTACLRKYGESGEDVEKLLRGQMAKDRGLSRDEAFDELVADACESMLLDSNAVEKVAELRSTDSELFGRIRQFIRRILNRLRAMYAGVSSYSEEGKALHEMTGTVEKLAKLFEDAALDAVSNRSGIAKTQSEVTTADNIVEGDKTKHSLRADYVRELDNWDGDTTGFSFTVGKTSDALIKAGIPNKLIKLDATKVKNAIKKHSGMNIEIFKNIPDLLEHPVVVIDSKRNENSKIVMGDLYDGNGNVVTTVLLLAPTSKKGNVLDIIKISSAEGRGHIESLFKNGDSYNVPVRYVDEKRVQNWLNANRLQLPLHSFNSDSDSSISEKSEKVNSLSENISKTDIRHSYKGINKDGIEVYETSEDTMSLTRSERVKKYLKLLENDYVGRTAKFIRNGHVYYAEFDRANPRKSVYGEKHFTADGKKAYIKAGADGDVFNLIENSVYDYSLADAKNHKSKDGFTDYFDYFVKTVQIDGKVFDLRATVKKKYGADGGYAYTLFLKKNNRMKASPAGSTQGALQVEGDAFDKDYMQFSPKSQVEISTKSKKSKKINREALETITESQYEEMKKHFGVTRDIRVAGYLLTDGSMLDFSGKHWGDIGSKTRQVDHRDISEVLPDGSENYGAMVRMIANGNIRLMPESGGICLSQPPTDRQRQALRYYIDMYSRRIGDSDGVIVDFDEPGGDTVYSRTYDKGTDADTVMKDIDKYFRYGNRSELMSFHDGSDIRYSLKKGAEQDVEKVLNQIRYTEDVFLTESSPDIMVEQKGVENLPMLMKASHIRENVFTEKEAKARGLRVSPNIHYHGLGKDLFLKIIDGLGDVGLAYRGTKNAADPSRRENYFLLISQYRDANGNMINIPVFINETGQYNRVFIGTNKIATVFGRDDLKSYIQREIGNGNLVRIKKRSTQVGELTSLINASYDENASDSSISQKSENVNSFSKNFEKNGYSKKSEGEMSDRELLANALETTIDTDTQAGQNELKILREYKDRIEAV